MKVITIALTAALTSSITIIVTAALGSPVNRFFNNEQLEAVVDLSRWHPYPTASKSPSRSTFGVLHLENPTSEKITNIRVRFDGAANADVLRADRPVTDLAVHVDQFDFEDMNPGDERLYYLWFDKPVSTRTLDSDVRFFSSKGKPRLLLLGSKLYAGEPWETLDEWSARWMPAIAGLLSLLLVCAIALVENKNSRALKRVLKDDEYYLGEKIRFEENPKTYVPSRPS